jgi:hypothetical protein
MKVIIAGSRSIDDESLVKDAYILYGPSGNHSIISGDARGVDSVAEDVADDWGMEYEEYEADWDEHGKAAGPIRNKEMAEEGDRLIAVWDGDSRGTRDMIDKALNEGLDVSVYTVDEENS